jgi:2-methylcitrate dehydratase PrpD
MCVANGALFAFLAREQSSSRLLAAAVASEHGVFGVVHATRNFSGKIRVHKALEGRVRGRTTPLVEDGWPDQVRQ